jgi:hypothetical protein
VSSVNLALNIIFYCIILIKLVVQFTTLVEKKGRNSTENNFFVSPSVTVNVPLLNSFRAAISLINNYKSCLTAAALVK